MPSSGVMKPNPLSALNHLTVPVAMLVLRVVVLRTRRRLERRLRALAPCQPEPTARTITDDNNHALDMTDDGCPQLRMARGAVRRRYRRDGAGCSGRVQAVGAVKATTRRSIAEDFPVDAARRRDLAGRLSDGPIPSASRSSREVQDHLDGRLGSVPEPAQRIAGSDLAVSQLLGFAEVLELLERLVLDLADPLAGDVERAPDLVERARGLAAEAVAQLEHAALAVGEVLKRVSQGFIGQDLRGALVGRLGLLVGDELAELGLAPRLRPASRARSAPARSA